MHSPLMISKITLARIRFSVSTTSSARFILLPTCYMINFLTSELLELGNQKRQHFTVLRLFLLFLLFSALIDSNKNLPQFLFTICDENFLIQRLHGPPHIVAYSTEIFNPPGYSSSCPGRGGTFRICACLSTSHVHSR